MHMGENTQTIGGPYAGREREVRRNWQMGENACVNENDARTTEKTEQVSGRKGTKESRK